MTGAASKTATGQAPEAGSRGSPGGGAWMICLFLAAATLAAYWPVRHFDFVNYDDLEGIANHPAISNGLTLEGVAWAFQNRHMANWQPLTSLSHMLDCQLFGLRPGPPHLVNLAFHVANTLLLFLLLRSLTGARWRSAFVAAVFALHPLHVESVAWVSERKDVLSTFFFMLTLLAYGRWARKSEGRNPKTEASPKAEIRKPGNTHHASRITFHAPRSTLHAPRSTLYALSLLFFSLGLMSKPMLVTTPFVLLLLDCWPLRRFDLSNLSRELPTLRRLVWEKAPFFLLALAMSGITVLSQHRSQAVVALADWPLSDRLANATVSCVRYIQKTCWPESLIVYYPRVAHWPPWQVAGAAILLAAITLCVLRPARRLPFLAVGWLWFLGTLVPVIGLVQVGNQAMADRYTYIPMIGLLILATWGIADLWIQWRLPRIALGCLAAAALASCLGLARIQVSFWQNGCTLFSHVLAVAPDVPLAHNNLGAVLYNQGKIDEAVACFNTALRLKPRYVDAHNNLGLALWRRGRDSEAIEQFNAVLKLGPDAKAYYNLGVVLFSQQKSTEAKECFLAAIRLQPDHAEARNNLGNVLIGEGKVNEAGEQFAAAVRSAPFFAEARCNLAEFLASKGDGGKAIEQYAAALRCKPESPEAHSGLARLLEQAGQLPEAAEHYAAAARLRPDLAEAHNNLSNLAARLNNPQMAFTHGRAAVELKPDWPEAHFNLGNALLLQGRLEDAAARYSEALRLNPGYSEACQNLGFTLEKLGRDKEAADRYAELVRLQPGSASAFNRLAIVLARQGRFEEATKAAEEGIRQATASGQNELAGQLRENLRRYQLRKP